MVLLEPLAITSHEKSFTPAVVDDSCTSGTVVTPALWNRRHPTNVAVLPPLCPMRPAMGDPSTWQLVKIPELAWTFGPAAPLLVVKWQLLH